MIFLLQSSSFTWFIVVLIGFVHFHVRKWKKEFNSIQTINHKKTAFIRCLLLLPSTIGLSLSHPWPWYYALIPSTLIQFFLFWLLFDGLYNIKRNFNWWFMGTIDKDESVTDNFIRKHGQVIKLAGCALSIAFYFLTLFKFKFVL